MLVKGGLLCAKGRATPVSGVIIARQSNIISPVKQISDWLQCYRTTTSIVISSPSELFPGLVGGQTLYLPSYFSHGNHHGGCCGQSFPSLSSHQNSQGHAGGWSLLCKEKDNTSCWSKYSKTITNLVKMHQWLAIIQDHNLTLRTLFKVWLEDRFSTGLPVITPLPSRRVLRAVPLFSPEFPGSRWRVESSVWGKNNTSCWSNNSKAITSQNASVTSYNTGQEPIEWEGNM